MSDLRAKIGREIYVAIERLGAEVELLAIVGSYGDTLDDDEIHEMLEEYNGGRRIIDKL